MTHRATLGLAEMDTRDHDIESATMDLNDPATYDYHLPDELIAPHPVTPRPASRLLVSPPHGEPQLALFADIGRWLTPGDLLVFNDTRVVPCRLFARKPTGGRVEVFVLGTPDNTRPPWDAPIPPEGLGLTAFIRANRVPSPGQALTIETPGDPPQLLTAERRLEDGTWLIRVHGPRPLGDLLEDAGHVPLPPYIVSRRKALGEPEEVEADRDRYQTVYARRPGAVAAPTAGLHFSEALIAQLKEAGVEVGFVTLHVGAGTFKPLADGVPLDAQSLHVERYLIEPALEAQIARCVEAGGRIVAVGTTSARALEAQGVLHGERRVVAGAYDTQLFIRPGWRWQLVDGLVTNFHLPRSSLLVMISALIGYKTTMRNYQRAIAERLRFYSYGDASLLWRRATNEATP